MRLNSEFMAGLMRVKFFAQKMVDVELKRKSIDKCRTNNPVNPQSFAPALVGIVFYPL